MSEYTTVFDVDSSVSVVLPELDAVDADGFVAGFFFEDVRVLATPFFVVWTRDFDVPQLTSKLNRAKAKIFLNIISGFNYGLFLSH